MKTILYNTSTQEITHHAPSGYYLVDGKRPELPNNIVELEYIDSEVPNTGLHQKVLGGNFVADLENGQYKKNWDLVQMSQIEIDLEDWKYDEFPIMLEVDQSVLFTPMGNAYRSYLQDRGYIVEMQSDQNYKIWVDIIQPQHQPYVDSLVADGKCVVKNIPTT